MVSARALHKLAEDIYEALDREGYWDEDSRGRSGSRTRRSRRGNRSIRYTPPARKRTRRVSAYQKEFGRQLKKLKKKHPRTKMSTLMKRAHAATKRARRGR